MNLIDGKAVSAQIKIEIAEEVKQIKASGGKTPHLAAVLVGHDGGSETYVANKVKACEQVGFKSTLIRYEDDVTEEELLKCVNRLNKDTDIDGFIVQLPLPNHISEIKITEAIDYRKDVDGFHPVNVGRMSLGMPCFLSATPSGILELLKRYNIETKGKHCVVLGRSNIVGKPVSMLMMQKTYPGDCTVTVCHSRTNNIKEICLQADIIIAALGVPEFLTGDMVKEGSVVIARILICVEIILMMKAINIPITFVQSVLIESIQSLISNLFFFMPMQMGTREGGFVIIYGILSIPVAYGVFVSISKRMRELFWTVIGILLIKAEKR